MKALLLSALLFLLRPIASYAERNLVCWANHKGSEGLVVVGTTAIAELRGWELSESAETIEDTILGDSFKTFKAGNKTWSGSASCFWDETDTTGQGALDNGAEVGLVFYAEGTGTGATRFSGTAIVTGVTRRAGINAMVEADFTFQGNGTLTEGTS